MRIAEMLQTIASWLENPDNEALLLAEYNNECLKVVAKSCIEAADILKKAASEVEKMEPAKESNITPESLQGLAHIATAFDTSDDINLKKQASVIDELLLTIAAPPNVLSFRKDLEDNRLEELRKKYNEPRKELEKNNKIADSEKSIDKSKMTKQYSILEAPLSSRYCPDHAGAQIARIGEHTWQCELDKKIYNFETGFELNNGSKVPGGDVSQQTQVSEIPLHSIFDTRNGRMESNKT